MNFRIDGLDKALSSLQELEQRARNLDGSHKVGFHDLFTPVFMKRNTRFSSFDEMLDHSKWTVEGPDDFTAIPDEPWDGFVEEVTQFNNWAEMQEAAVTEWASNQLGL